MNSAVALNNLTGLTTHSSSFSQQSLATLYELYSLNTITTSAFLSAPHLLVAGSSAWANTNAETANLFMFSFHKDLSVLGLTATPSYLHMLTLPNMPSVMMTISTANSATPNTSGGVMTGHSAGMFVSVSWGAPSASNGTGAGIGVGPGPSIICPFSNCNYMAHCSRLSLHFMLVLKISCNVT